jgi:hypothetical protein
MAYKVRMPLPPPYVNPSYENIQSKLTPANIGGPGAQILNIESDGASSMTITFVAAYSPTAAQRTSIKDTLRNFVTTIEDNQDTAF